MGQSDVPQDVIAIQEEKARKERQFFNEDVKACSSQCFVEAIQATDIMEMPNGLFIK